MIRRTIICTSVCLLSAGLLFASETAAPQSGSANSLNAKLPLTTKSPEARRLV